jgi:uncharacterized protein (DUF305 family)
MKIRLFLASAIVTATLIPALNAQAAGPYSAAEVHFAQMMIPHHTQALLISQWELTQGSNPATKKLAARIIAEQSPEIAQMKKWLPASKMKEMAMPMPGIVSDADLAKMRAATGKKFDGLYLVNMTMHHQGAIAMAQAMLTSKNPEVLALCKAIISGQKAEIAQMSRIMKTGK